MYCGGWIATGCLIFSFVVVVVVVVDAVAVDVVADIDVWDGSNVVGWYCDNVSESTS